MPIEERRVGRESGPFVFLGNSWRRGGLLYTLPSGAVSPHAVGPLTAGPCLCLLYVVPCPKPLSASEASLQRLKRETALRRVLMVGDSRSQVCESMGIPRQTLSDWLREEREARDAEESATPEALEGPDAA